MRKAVSVGDLCEYVKMWKILGVANATLFGLTAVWLLSSWSSTPDLARRNLALINATFVLGLAGSILRLRKYRRQLDSQPAGIR